MNINTCIIFINVYFTEVTITTKALIQSEWKINFQEKKNVQSHILAIAEEGNQLENGYKRDETKEQTAVY